MLKKFKSLRARLIVLILSSVALIWLVVAVLTWRAARHELAELLSDHPATERREITDEIAEHLLKPMVVALPLLGVLLTVMIGAALRPLRRLVEELEARAPDKLAPLSLEDAPREVAPLVRRLNVLFDDVERVLANERRFTADAAHELRTPLAALKAQAQVALAADDDAPRRHALSMIVQGCDRATRLVEQLLTLARLDARRASGKDAGIVCERVEIGALAAEVLAATAGEAAMRGTDLAFEAPGTVHVEAVPDLLRLALRNLVENALRHTPGGSRIEVSIAAVGDGVELRVADNGPGIPVDERGKVTQRFYRVADGERSDVADVGGCGLGLAIVTQTAAACGASLRLDVGLDGRGTAACLFFPQRYGPTNRPSVNSSS